MTYGYYFVIFFTINELSGKEKIMSFIRCFLIMILTYLPVAGISKPNLNNGNGVEKSFGNNEIILNYKKDIKVSRIEDITNEMEVEIVYRSLFANFITIRFDDSKRNLWKLIEAFESFPEIDFAEPNGIVHMFWTPNDYYFYLQWNFDAGHINMPLAWDIERGGNSSVIVSILDTGIAFEDFLIPLNEQGEVSSGDGYYHQSPDLSMTYFVDGYDFINDDAHPNDENGHGTHVCGTIAQTTNNGKGVAGMAFKVSIMPIRILDETGSGNCDKIADGIYYAYQNGADILSMSLGGDPGDSTGFETIHEAIISATDAGAIVVAAAGNSDTSQLSYPAGFAECIAVGATDYDNKRAPYSQWGVGIDIVAPGGDINKPLPGVDTLPAAILQSTYYQINDGFNKATVDSFCYMFLQGTSMATPHVAALAALLISHGITEPSAVRQAIYSSATDLGSPGYDIYFGNGLINPAAALGANPLFSSLPVIQNPYCQQYVDVWVVSNEPLLNDLPDTCRITFNGTETYLNFQKVDEQTYRTDFFFDTSGVATIYVSARDTSGTQGTITRIFTVTEIDALQGGMAESQDSLFRITIPGDNYNNSYWVLIEDEKAEIDPSLFTALSRIYRCGPEGNRLNIPSVVQFDFDKGILKNNDFRDVGIYRKNGDEFEYFNTEIDTINGYAYAKVEQFGRYILILCPGKGGSIAINRKGLSLNCYPNPTSRRLFFEYSVPSPASVDIALYDVSGRKVKNIEEGTCRNYGIYTGSLMVNDAKLSSGIYFLRVTLSSERTKFQESKKIILLQ